MHQNILFRFSHIFLASSILALITLPGGVFAGDSASAPDKSSYNLFNRTPSDQLRPLSLDANDGVIDAVTVDAGHVQAQGDLVDYYRYSRDYNTPFAISGEYTRDHFNWSPRISLGILNNVDVFVHPSFDVDNYSYYGGRHTRNSSQYAGLNVGTKINLWGNDGGMTAFSVAPYLSIPDHSDVSGGGDISLAVRLPGQFYFKVCADPFVFYRNNYTEHFGVENGASLHRTFGAKLDAYAYLNTIWTDDSEEWQGYSGFGLGYQICRNLEVFLGMGFGLTDNSYDYNPCLGLGWRF